MTARAARGHVTMERVAARLALDCSIPAERALALVQAAFRAIREDIATAPRFVLPGVLVIDRLPDGARRSHSVRFVLGRRRREAAKIAAQRARARAG